MMLVALHTRLLPGEEERYEELHRAVWPEVLQRMREVGLRRYLIFRDGCELFHLVECDDYDAAMAALAADPINQRWEATVAPLTAVPHDLSGGASDRMACIFDMPPDAPTTGPGDGP